MPVNLIGKTYNLPKEQRIMIMDWVHWRPIWDFVGHYLINLSVEDFHMLEEFGGLIPKDFRDEMIIAITDALNIREQQVNIYRREEREILIRHGDGHSLDWEKLKEFLVFIENNEEFVIHA
ncbi:hypothetical protein LCGC14_0195640 [marine sediment metagenome]|uniref:Uncharacterized protein n=1 Tax=marine sediment metagenome TaxID=412755 RepID=A0A0F9X4F6_9ZZZZ